MVAPAARAEMAWIARALKGVPEMADKVELEVTERLAELAGKAEKAEMAGTAGP
jgi:hypothetical protein